MKTNDSAVDAVTFAIEKGIAIPMRWSGRQYKYPFRQMEVGDSFFVPEGQRSIDSMRGIAADTKKATGHRYSVRAVEGGCRIWRTE